MKVVAMLDTGLPGLVLQTPSREYRLEGSSAEVLTEWMHAIRLVSEGRLKEPVDLRLLDPEVELDEDVLIPFEMDDDFTLPRAPEPLLVAAPVDPAEAEAQAAQLALQHKAEAELALDRRALEQVLGCCSEGFACVACATHARALGVSLSTSSIATIKFALHKKRRFCVGSTTHRAREVTCAFCPSSLMAWHCCGC